MKTDLLSAGESSARAAAKLIGAEARATVSTRSYEKVGMLARLRKGKASIPAGRIYQDRAVILADRAAVGDRTG